MRVAKRCQDCPSYLNAKQAESAVGRAIGSPICGRFGHLLGRPGLPASSVNKIGQSFAENCSEFGQPQSVMVEIKEKRYVPAIVAIPDGSIHSRGAPPAGAQTANCGGCINFVPADEVRKELGWYLPMCAAWGRLLWPNRLSEESRNCPWNWQGPPRDTTAGMQLRAEYESGFAYMKIQTNPYVEHDGIAATPPEDYISGKVPSDKPVTDKHRAKGIVAWRKLSAPDFSLGRDVSMPVFSDDAFSEAERALIPRTGSDEHPELYVDYAYNLYQTWVESWQLDETPCYIGQAGTGKTELARHAAWMMNVPFRRLQITKASEIDDLAGKWLFEAGETAYHLGRVAVGWAAVGVLCIDEFPAGSDEIFQFFRPMFDNSKQLVLDQEKGKRVERNPYCFPILTMNPTWDISYQGLNEVDEANASRLTFLSFDLPSPTIERAIIKKRCELDEYDISDGMLETLQKINTEIREMTGDGGGLETMRWGIRDSIAVARKTAWYDLTHCYKLARTNLMEPRQAKLILDVVQSHEDADLDQPNDDGPAF